MTGVMANMKQLALKAIAWVARREPRRVGDEILLSSRTTPSLAQAQAWYELMSRHTLANVLQAYAITCVLDVGADYGQFATSLRSAGYRGQIVSFEPVEKVRGALITLASTDPKWSVYGYAIGDVDGVKTLHVAKSPGFSSLLLGNEYGRDRFGDAVAEDHQEEVPVRRLDSIWEEVVPKDPDVRILLKTDTQGYDVQVFTGLGRHVRDIAALQAEVSVVPIYRDAPHLTDAIALYEKEGFEIAAMVPVTMDEPTGRVIEFDCLMVDPDKVVRSDV